VSPKKYTIPFSRPNPNAARWCRANQLVALRRSGRSRAWFFGEHRKIVEFALPAGRSRQCEPCASVRTSGGARRFVRILPASRGDEWGNDRIRENSQPARRVALPGQRVPVKTVLPRLASPVPALREAASGGSSATPMEAVSCLARNKDALGLAGTWHGSSSLRNARAGSVAR